MSKQELKQKGFTIIEVVLVLAIAALIFLMVFIALPALQRSQRDTARKNDVSVIASAVSSWQGNNRATSAWPTNVQLKAYATNISGNTTDILVGDAVAADKTKVEAADATVTVYPKAKCSSVSASGEVILDKGSARQYATVTRLESGSESGYCLDS
ncbi:MAG: prepilin-type N-terminal cleavage/methylation domain-containing protein [Candidatus Saccharimonas sp.]